MRSRSNKHIGLKKHYLKSKIHRKLHPDADLDDATGTGRECQQRDVPNTLPRPLRCRVSASSAADRGDLLIRWE